MLDDQDIDQARYEIKFVAQQAEFFRFKNWLMLNPSGFQTFYPARTVNNVYFDNYDCDSYWENLTGCTSRTKIRLRWYGEGQSVTQARLEFKSKRNRLGFKSGYSITFEKPLQSMNYEEICQSISAQLPEESLLRFKLSGTPILYNQYYREYFQDSNGALRATIDKSIKFFDQRGKHGINTLFQSLAPEISILEVKSPASKIDLAEKALENIQLAPSKSSKYVIGVQSLLGYQ